MSFGDTHCTEPECQHEAFNDSTSGKDIPKRSWFSRISKFFGWWLVFGSLTAYV
jgi:hypothetical protein